MFKVVLLLFGCSEIVANRICNTHLSTLEGALGKLTVYLKYDRILQETTILSMVLQSFSDRTTILFELMQL